MRRIALFNKCPYCREAQDIYSSNPEGWRDEVCLFLLLQVVRCHSCTRRHYRPLFLPPVPVAPGKKSVHVQVEDKKRSRSA